MGSTEAILQRLNNSDKAVVRTVTSSTVGNIDSLWNLLIGKALLKYELLIKPMVLQWKIFYWRSVTG